MGLFDFAKRKRPISEAAAALDDPNRYKPGSAVYEALRGVVSLFANAMMTQCEILSTSPAFRHMGVSIGPGVQFELCCFNLAVLNRELKDTRYFARDMKEITVQCFLWLAVEPEQEFGRMALLDTVNERTEHYRELIERNWDEAEHPWEFLFGACSSDILAYILAGDGSVVNLRPYQELEDTADRDTLYGRAAMSYHIGNACFNTVPHMVYIFRKWCDTGRLFDLTETEMRRLLPSADAEANAVLEQQRLKNAE